MFLIVLPCLRIWDTRSLSGATNLVPSESRADADASSYPTTSVYDDTLESYLESDPGQNALQAEWAHGGAVTSVSSSASLILRFRIHKPVRPIGLL